MARRRGQRTLYIAPVVFLLAGCATTTDQLKLIELMWPEPPLTARIKFVTALTSEEDLGHTPTFTELLLQMVTGKKPPAGHLTEPVDVAVSDFGQGLVYRFDLE